MTKFLCYGDLHLREFGSFQPYNKIDTNGLTLELNNIVMGSEFLSDLIRQEKPDVVFDLGDFFHDKNSLSSKTLYAASLCCNNIKSACDEVGAKCYMLMGNHNYFSEVNKISNCEILDGYFSVIKEPIKLKFGDITVGVIPYSSKYELVQESLNNFKNECNLILTHLEFKGCVFDTDIVSVKGFDPDLGVPCISGHIHTTQTVKDVMYIGSLIQNTFSTYNLDKVGGAFVFSDDNVFDGVLHKNFKSRHYIKVTSLDYLFDNIDCFFNKAVLKIITDKETYESFKPLVSKFEHMFMPVAPEKQSMDLKIEAQDDFDPVSLLRSYIMNKYPEHLMLCDRF